MSINRQIDKEVVMHIYKGVLLSQERRNEFESDELMWMNIEPVIQSEVSQKEKGKYHTLMYIYGI